MFIDLNQTRLETDDMALVTTLCCHGYNFTMRRGQNDKHVVWVLSEEELDDFASGLVEDYRAGDARVEPNRFMRETRSVRQRMYHFLGISSTPIARAS